MSQQKTTGKTIEISSDVVSSSLRFIDELVNLNQVRIEAIRKAIMGLVTAQVTQVAPAETDQKMVDSLRSAERATMLQITAGNPALVLKPRIELTPSLSKLTASEHEPELTSGAAASLTLDDVINQISASRMHQYIQGLLRGLENDPLDVQVAIRTRLMEFLEPRKINYLSPEHLGYEIQDLVDYHQLKPRIFNQLIKAGKAQVREVITLRNNMVELREDLQLNDKQKGELFTCLETFGIPFNRQLTAIEKENFTQTPLLLKTEEEKRETRETKIFVKSLNAGIETLGTEKGTAMVRVVRRLQEATRREQASFIFLGDLVEADSNGVLQLVEPIRLQKLWGIAAGSVNMLTNKLKIRGMPLGEALTPEQEKHLAAFKLKR